MKAARASSKTLIAAALILAGLVVLAASASFLRNVETFQQTGFSAELIGGHWLVTEVGEPDTGLLALDQILLVNGEGPAALDDLRAALSGRAESELLVLRGEEMSEIRYRRPAMAINLPPNRATPTSCIRRCSRGSWCALIAQQVRSSTSNRNPKKMKNNCTRKGVLRINSTNPRAGHRNHH